MKRHGVWKITRTTTYMRGRVVVQETQERAREIPQPKPGPMLFATADEVVRLCHRVAEQKKLPCVIRPEDVERAASKK